MSPQAAVPRPSSRWLLTSSMPHKPPMSSTALSPPWSLWPRISAVEASRGSGETGIWLTWLWLKHRKNVIESRHNCEAQAITNGRAEKDQQQALTQRKRSHAFYAIMHRVFLDQGGNGLFSHKDLRKRRFLHRNEPKSL